MPTTRPCHCVTETDELALALDEAGRHWPEMSRGQLIVHLARQGHQMAQSAAEERRSQRLGAIRKHSGALTGVYGPDYLAELREEWTP